MAKAAENYLKMHHPSLHKKMYGKGGKVKKGYKKGGYVKSSSEGFGEPSGGSANWGDSFTYDPMPLKRNKADLLQESIKNTIPGDKWTEKRDNEIRDAVIDKKYKEGAVSEEPGYQEGGEIENPLSPEDQKKQAYWDKEFDMRVGADYKRRALLRNPAVKYAMADYEDKTRKPDYGVKTPKFNKSMLKDKPYPEGVASNFPERVSMGNRHSGNRAYAGGGQVKKAQALQGMGDVVDAKLTPGEIVLNADQQGALEQELGQPIDGLMSKIGVPGFEGGGKVKPVFKVGMIKTTRKFTREKTVAEKRKLKVLRTKSKKKKGK